MVTTRNLFVLGVTAYGLGMAKWLVRSVQEGDLRGTFFITLLVSPAFVVLIWSVFQHCQPHIPSWRHMSCSAVGGDTLVLPAMMTLIAAGWLKADKEKLGAFWTSGWWFSICFVVGVITGWLFHQMGGPSDSNSQILSQRLHDAPLAWAHDIGIVSALTCAGLCTLVPLFLQPVSRPFALLALGCFAIWVGLVAVDSIRAARPSTSRWYFDPNWTNIDTHGYWKKLW